MAQDSAKLAYMDEQDKRVKFMAKLPPDLHRRLKVAAAEQGADMNALIVAALESALTSVPGQITITVERVLRGGRP